MDVDPYLRLIPVTGLLVCAASCWRRSRSGASLQRQPTLAGEVVLPGRQLVP